MVAKGFELGRPKSLQMTYCGGHVMVKGLELGRLKRLQVTK